MKLAVITFAVTAAISAPLASAGEAAAGKQKAVVCTACHGANGKATIPTYPHLAGQNKQYLVSAIKAYRDGGRTGGQASIMAGMAKPLSDEDIANLAAYYSAM